MDVVRRDPQDPARCADDCCEVGTLPGEQADLAHEFARPVRHNHEFVRLSIMLNNPGLAFDQNDQVISLIAVAEEHIADGHGLFGPIAMEGLELSPAQGRPVAWLLRRSLRDGGAISHRELSVQARRKACALPPCAFEGTVGAIGPLQRKAALQTCAGVRPVDAATRCTVWFERWWPVPSGLYASATMVPCCAPLSSARPYSNGLNCT